MKGLEIEIGGLTDAVAQLLAEYGDEVNEKLEETSNHLGKEAVQRLKDTSPRSKLNHSHYADDWAKRKDGHGCVVYNREHFQLTHLLEHSHPMRNQVKGKTYGMSKPHPHIEPVEKWVQDSFIPELKRRLE